MNHASLTGRFLTYEFEPGKDDIVGMVLRVDVLDQDPLFDMIVWVVGGFDGSIVGMTMTQKQLAALASGELDVDLGPLGTRTLSLLA